MSTMDGGNQNETVFSYTEFVLFGFPGIIRNRKLLLVPFSIVYVIIVCSNLLVIYRISVEQSLHSPMYVLISLLFTINISYTTSVLPKFLVGLSFGLNEISLSGCLAQIFYISFTSLFESGVMLMMALDRFVAVCRPLRYNDIMTTRFLVQLCVAGIVRSIVFIAPVVILTASARFCKSNVILNFVCENMGLLGLACGDTSRQQALGLVIRILATISDVGLLLLSYSWILYTALKIAAGKARHKALHTCGSHLTVAIIIYLAALLSSVMPRLHTQISPDIENVFSAVYHMTPSSLNPFVYGLGVKEIRRCLMKSWRRTTMAV